jgi:hypothetical protein
VRACSNSDAQCVPTCPQSGTVCSLQTSLERTAQVIRSALAQTELGINGRESDWLGGSSVTASVQVVSVKLTSTGAIEVDERALACRERSAHLAPIWNGNQVHLMLSAVNL